jgi:hypothetical protein
MIAFQFAARRRLPQGGNNDQILSAILGWNDLVLPDLRKAE